jgi:hypothetical protein
MTKIKELGFCASDGIRTMLLNRILLPLSLSHRDASARGASARDGRWSVLKLYILGILQVLNYPCGFKSKNIYLSIGILFSVVIAYLIRLWGLDNIVIWICSSLSRTVEDGGSLASLALHPSLALPSPEGSGGTYGQGGLEIVLILSVLIVFVLNSTWLKFMFSCKLYYLIKYFFLSELRTSRCSAQVSGSISKGTKSFVYLMINCLFLILISFIIILNDLALVKADPYIIFGSIFNYLSYVFSGERMSNYPLSLALPSPEGSGGYLASFSLRGWSEGSVRNNDVLILPLLITIYTYICALTLATLWIEWHHQSINLLDEWKSSSDRKLSILEIGYLSFIWCLLLIPITWFLIFIFSDSSLKIIYCSSNEEILNQQSNSNEQSFGSKEEVSLINNSDVNQALCDRSNSTENPRSECNNEKIKENVKVKSNIQSNVNKQNSDNVYKNKQQNINVQVFPYSKTYSSPPVYNPQ